MYDQYVLFSIGNPSGYCGLWDFQVDDFAGIVVKCTPDDAGNPVLKGLSLAISEVEDAPLDLVKSSQTMWKYNGMVEM